MEKYRDKFNSFAKFCDFNQFSAKLDSTAALPEEPQVYEESMKYSVWKCIQAELTKYDVTHMINRYENWQLDISYWKIFVYSLLLLIGTIRKPNK